MKIHNLYLKVNLEDVLIGEAFNRSFGKTDLFFVLLVGWLLVGFFLVTCS